MSKNAELEHFLSSIPRSNIADSAAHDERLQRELGETCCARDSAIAERNDAAAKLMDANDELTRRELAQIEAEVKSGESLQKLKNEHAASLEELKRRGIKFANAPGVIQFQVAEHALALMLGLNRHIHTGRDNQNNHTWRGMLGDLSKREDELYGKTMVIIGMGAAGSRLAKIAKAFDMRVLATKRDPSTAVGPADEVVTPDRLAELVPEADFLVLTCPLTEETTNIVDAGVLDAMKPTSYLINVARGQCVDEPALLQALESGGIAGAGLDHFVQDPLGPESPFWGIKNVIITPHGSGESRLSEDRVLDIVEENLRRLWNGESELMNQIV